MTTVVGVVDDARFALIGDAPGGHLYLPARQHYRDWHTLVVQTRGDPAAMLVAHGGRLIFGSDAPSGPTFGNPPGLNGFLELERLARARIALDRLLAASTIEAARAFRPTRGRLPSRDPVALILKLPKALMAAIGEPSRGADCRSLASVLRPRRGPPNTWRRPGRA